MAADLTVTIGADLSELENGIAAAGQTISRGANRIRSSGGVGAGGGTGGTGGGGTGGGAGGAGGIKMPGGGGTFAAIGAMFGPEGLVIGEILDQLTVFFDKIKELMDYAKRLRNISVATGITTGELQKLEGVATACGISLETLAHAVAEFNRRIGEAKIRGSELNNLLVKLGVSMTDIKNGSVRAEDGMLALARAFEAGTDEATLMYYGVKMFGSAFEQMLPIIKRGSEALAAYRAQTLQNSEVATSALARLSDEWDLLWHNMKVAFMEYLGWQLAAVYNLIDSAKLLALRTLALVSPAAAGRAAAGMLSPSLTPEQRKVQLDILKQGMTPEQIRAFDAAYSAAVGGKGTKLNPFGMAEAGAASQMQQMAGGDIFGAVAFTPLESIKEYTERTAIATEKIAFTETPQKVFIEDIQER